MFRNFRRKIRTRGQAMVEFALTATILFMLLGAAVDLGLMFFTIQGIHNAAQEGATYGSRWLSIQNNVWQINVAEIQKRVRTESGESGSSSGTHLLDLDSNGVNDANQVPAIIDPTGATGPITVIPLEDTNRDGNPTNDANKRCDKPAASVLPCYVLVRVTKIYDVFFPIPVFGDKITLNSSYYMLIRSSFAEAGAGNPIFTAPQPTFGTSNIVMSIINNANGAGGLTNRNQTNFEVTAWDTAYGAASNGNGIASVTITISGPAGFKRVSGPYTQPRFCSYPSLGGCSYVSDVTSYPSGSYTITAVAKSKRGNSKTVTSLFTRP